MSFKDVILKISICYSRSFEQSVEEEEKMTKAAADNKSAKIKKVKNKNNFGNKDNVDSIEAVSFHLLQPKEELKEVEDELLRPESGSDEENRFVEWINFN